MNTDKRMTIDEMFQAIRNELGASESLTHFLNEVAQDVSHVAMSRDRSEDDVCELVTLHATLMQFAHELKPAMKEELEKRRNSYSYIKREYELYYNEGDS